MYHCHLDHHSLQILELLAPSCRQVESLQCGSMSLEKAASSTHYVLYQKKKVPIMSRHESRVSSKVVNTVPKAVTVCSVNTSVLFQAYR